MTAPTTQPEPAEGPRDDEAGRADRGGGEGVSAQDPAEGGAAVTPELDGSPQG